MTTVNLIAIQLCELQIWISIINKHNPLRITYLAVKKHNDTKITEKI